MEHCSKCGAENPNGVNFCTKCGNPMENTVMNTEQTDAIPEALPAAPMQEQKIKTPKLGIIALVLSIIGFLTAFMIVGLFLDVIAIVLGIIALVQSKKRTMRKTGQASS